MSREWKQGDVAMRTSAVDGHTLRSVATTCFVPAHKEQGLHWHHLGGGWDPMSIEGGPTYRPLVVIDPEDERDLDRLQDALITGGRHIEQGVLQAALREFANPTPPKPDEPMGLGAVVEDAGGTKWIRHDSVAIRTCWLNTDDCSTRYRAYGEIDAVTVLAQGVTP